MKKAVFELANIIKQKTVHSTDSILESMQVLCVSYRLFSNQYAQQEFAQRCRNFEIHSTKTGTRSWGRVQFIKWWDGFDAPEPGEFRQEYLGKPYSAQPEDPAVTGYSNEDSAPWDEEEPTGSFQSLSAANARIKELEAELSRMRSALNSIHGNVREGLGLRY